MKFRNLLILLLLSLSTLSFSCSSDSGTGLFDTNILIAIDSANSRLFAIQPGGEIYFLTANDQEEVGDQPIIDDENRASISNTLPNEASQMVIWSSGNTSRVFFLGAIENTDDEFVTNRITVLNYNGSSFSIHDMSPIALTDDDDSTTDTSSTFSDLLIDQSNDTLYITNTTLGLVYVIDPSDGSEVRAPIAVGGNPQGLSLADGKLFVCNTSDDEATQLITVIDTTDFTTTTIDIDVPCNKITAAANDNGTVIIVKQSNRQRVLIHSVDTDTFDTSSAIASSTEDINDGELENGDGISSAILSLNSIRDGDAIEVYLGEQDGKIRNLTIASDLDSFSLRTLDTDETGLSSISFFDRTNDIVYVTAESGGILFFDVGETDEEEIDSIN